MILLTVCVRISLEQKYKIIEVGKIVVRTSETKRIVVLKRINQIEQHIYNNGDEMNYYCKYLLL